MTLSGTLFSKPSLLKAYLIPDFLLCHSYSNDSSFLLFVLLWGSLLLVAAMVADDLGLNSGYDGLSEFFMALR